MNSAFFRQQWAAMQAQLRQSQSGSWLKRILVWLLPGDDVEQLLRKADLALYEAKQTGRNKVCIWSSTSATSNPATLPSDH